MVTVTGGVRRGAGAAQATSGTMAMQSTAVRVLPDAVLWHEGMLLAPQHFQQSALRGEELLHYRLHLASPFAWGVRRLQVDRRLLAEGTFRVTELEAVLPDGTVATVRADRDRPLETSVSAYEEDARRGALTVHLAVPAARSEGEPFAGQLQRYDRVEGAPVPDDNTGDGEIAIPRLRPRLTLLAGATAPDKYASLPLARVGFRDGAFVPTGFVPPLMAVDPDAAPSASLAAICADVAARLREKALFFADRLRASTGRARDLTTAELHAAVRALVSELPRLDALVSLRQAHPLDLYLALCGLAGRLAGLEGRVPPVFPRYDHTDLRATFEPVRAFCTRALDAQQEAFSAISFEWREVLFQTVPPIPEDGRPLLVGVRAGALGEPAAVAWMEECRIGSASRLPSLADRRIRGAARRRSQAAGDLQLAAGAGVVLFEVDTDPEFVVPGEPLQVAHPEGERRERPADLVLYTRNQPK
jgi:type VI secretion system protein ImpJ